jgi:hypothetical protein
MVVAVLALLLMSLFLFFMIASDLPRRNLREVWMGMSTLQELGVVAMFFASLAVFYRALAASVLATSEFSERREIGAIQAFRKVRWKHMRLFWLMMVAMFFGRSAPFVALIAGFFFASAFPTAVVEDLGAFQALKHGEKLAAGNQLRIATIYATYLVALAGVGLGILKVLVFVKDLSQSTWYTRPVAAIGRGLHYRRVVVHHRPDAELPAAAKEINGKPVPRRDVAAGFLSRGPEVKRVRGR